MYCTGKPQFLHICSLSNSHTMIQELMDYNDGCLLFSRCFLKTGVIYFNAFSSCRKLSEIILHFQFVSFCSSELSQGEAQSSTGSTPNCRTHTIWIGPLFKLTDEYHVRYHETLILFYNSHHSHFSSIPFSVNDIVANRERIGEVEKLRRRGRRYAVFNTGMVPMMIIVDFKTDRQTDKQIYLSNVCATLSYPRSPAPNGRVYKSALYHLADPWIDLCRSLLHLYLTVAIFWSWLGEVLLYLF